MPQPAVHAILALATRKTFSIKRWFAFGLIFGSLIPDADGYPQAFAILVQGMDAAKAETIYHRTLTHSLYFALGALALFYLISLVKGGRELRIFGLGLATGMALEGYIVFTYSIANFPTLRCLEQIRNDVCYHDLPVKIVSIGGGFLRAPRYVPSCNGRPGHPSSIAQHGGCRAVGPVAGGLRCGCPHRASRALLPAG